MSIKCGVCKDRHDTIAEVRACSGVPAGQSYATSQPDYDTRDWEGGAEPGQVARRIAAAAPRTGYASDKQAKFVKSLAATREMTDDTRRDALARAEQHLDPTNDFRMSFQFARNFIDGYKDSPYRTERRQTKPTAVTEDGYYLSPQTGQIYKVQFNKGQGDGSRLYAKLMVMERRTTGETFSKGILAIETHVAREYKRRFEYAPGLIREIQPEWRMTLAEAEKFGELYGVCMRCGRDLTKEESIARAMGDVCASKANWR